LEWIHSYCALYVVGTISKVSLRRTQLENIFGHPSAGSCSESRVEASEWFQYVSINMFFMNKWNNRPQHWRTNLKTTITRRRFLEFKNKSQVLSERGVLVYLSIGSYIGTPVQ
jgi:hypothetical protein